MAVPCGVLHICPSGADEIVLKSVFSGQSGLCTPAVAIRTTNELDGPFLALTA